MTNAENMVMIPGANLVGWGYDVRSEKNVARQIFKDTSEREVQEGAYNVTTISGDEYKTPLNLTVTNAQETQERSAYGESVEEYKEAYRVETRTQIGYKGYTMDERFGIDERTENSTYYAYITVAETAYRFDLSVLSDTRDQLTDEARSDIDERLSPRELFDRYGTHVLVAATMGGAYELNAAVAKSSHFTRQEITAGIRAKGAGMGLSFGGAADYSTIDETLREQLEGSSKVSKIGGAPTDDLVLWRASVTAQAQPVRFETLVPISEFAIGERRAELEAALSVLVRPGAVGGVNWGDTVEGFEKESADDWQIFVAPTTVGHVGAKHQGLEALLRFDMEAPVAPDPATAAWKLSGSYVRVCGRNEKPNNGTTFTTGTCNYALLPKGSARIVEISHDGEVLVDGEPLCDDAGVPIKADLLHGTPVFLRDPDGQRTDLSKWRILVAPAQIGTHVAGESKNSDDALLNFCVESTLDATKKEWVVRGSYLYRIAEDGRQEEHAAPKVRALLVRNPDVGDDLYRTGVVSDGDRIVAPDGTCQDWAVMLSPGMMGETGTATSLKHHAMLKFECGLTAGDRSWVVSATARCRRKSGVNDGDQITVAGTCGYLLVRLSSAVG